ncbi:MAG: DinB family protein [Gammaproteobacteria bacterium]
MKNHLLMPADYRVWAFEVLYGALLSVSSDQYFADSGLCFRSIHGTLNHLLVGEEVWYGRCVKDPFDVPGLDAEIEGDRAELERRLYTQSARWKTWIAGQDEAALARNLVYQNMSGADFRNSLPSILPHVFNHGTHHRGQISSAISGFGHNVPEMDLIWYLRGLDA